MPEDVLYPNNPYASDFFQYFSHGWDFIIANAKTKTWQTISDYKLQPRVLWRKFNDTNILLGVRFGKTTTYGMADVDFGSLLHFEKNRREFEKLCQAFEDIGLCRFVIARSSSSEGVHIYLPLTEEVHTFSLACALRMAVESAGFKVQSGQLELFPNTKSFKKNENKNNFSHYNGHRLPLQPKSGSAVLDDDLSPESLKIGEFLRQMKWAAEGQDMERLKEVLPLAREWYSKRYLFFSKSENSSKVQEWKEDTEAIISEGFTDFGQTNDILREIGKYGYVFQPLEKAQLEKYMVETVTNLPGYSEYCQHQHEIEKRCAQWARSIEKYWWKLGTPPTRETNYEKMNSEGRKNSTNPVHNQELAEDCLKRLKRVLAHIKEQGMALPSKVGERFKLLCEIGKMLFGKGFNLGILKKPCYRGFWHPKYSTEQPSNEYKGKTTSSEESEASQEITDQTDSIESEISQETTNQTDSIENETSQEITSEESEVSQEIIDLTDSIESEVFQETTSKTDSIESEASQEITDQTDSIESETSQETTNQTDSIENETSQEITSEESEVSQEIIDLTDSIESEVSQETTNETNSIESEVSQETTNETNSIESEASQETTSEESEASQEIIDLTSKTSESDSGEETKTTQTQDRTIELDSLTEPHKDSSDSPEQKNSCTSEKVNQVLQEQTRVNDSVDKDSKKTTTPPKVVRKNELNSKGSKPSSNGQYSENDHTPPFMKGIFHEVGFDEIVQSENLDQSGHDANTLENKKQDNQKIQNELNKNSSKILNQTSSNLESLNYSKTKNQKSTNSGNINNSYTTEVRQASQKGHKKNLSKAQSEYQEEMMRRFPEQRAWYEERQKPENQELSRQFFDKIRRILKKASDKRL